MRGWGWMLTVAGALLVLAGCSKNETFVVQGLVRDLAGAQVAGAQVQMLSQEGTPVTPVVTTGADGAFTFGEVAPGSYTVSVSGTAPRTVFGPVQVVRETTGLTVVAATQAQLPPTATVPTDGTASLVAFLAEPSGTIVPEYTVQVDALPSFATTTGGPIVIDGLAPGSYNIVLADTQTGRTVTLPSVPLPANTLTVARGVLSTLLTSPLTGEVVDDAAVARTGAAVRLCRDGGPVGAATHTSSTGRFTLGNIAPGAGYMLDTTGAGLVRTWFGPFDVGQEGRRDLRLWAPSLAHMRDGIGVATPTDGTATLVVFAIRPDGATVPVHVATNAGAPCPAANPAVIDSLVAAPVLVTATLDGDPDAVRAEYVSVLANQVTVLRMPWPR